MTGNLLKELKAEVSKGEVWSWAGLEPGASRLLMSICFSARTAWVQKIKAASEQYIDTEKRKREKAYQGTC